MKQLLTFLFVLIAASGFSQNWSRIYSYNQYLGLRADSQFIPPQDTLRSPPVGAFAIKNNHVYQKLSTGIWSQVDGGGNGVQSLTGSQSIQYGTFAAMPAAGTIGRYYAATDLSQWYFDNGVSWLNLTGVVTFNSRSGAVVLSATDISAALGYTPLSNTASPGQVAIGNGSGFLTPMTVTGDIGFSSSGVGTINANTITNSKAAPMPANTIKGNNTGSTANAADLTATQVTAMLNVFTPSLQGLVPSSGGGTSNFLRADGTWAPGGAVSPNWINVVNSGVDNTGATDVTSQINTLQASGNKNLYFPPGSYAIKELKMLDSVFFRGDGMKTKFIVSTNDTILTTGNYDRIIGITFIGNRGTTAQIAVNADKTVGTYVNDCQFINMGVGIRTARSAQRVGSGVRVGNVFSDLQGNGNNIGAWCDVQGEYNSFNNIHFPGSLVYGFKNAAGNNYFDRCDADSSAVGFYLQGGTNDAHSTMVNSHFNHCYQKSFYSQNVANGFQIVGSAFYYARFEIDTSVNIVVQNSFIDCTGDSLVLNTVTQSSFSNCIFPTTPTLKQVGTNTVTFRSDQQSWDRTDVTTGIHLDDPFHAKHFNLHHNNGVVTYGGTDITQNILYGTIYTDLPGIILNGTAGAQTATINSTTAGNLQITATGGKVGIQTAAPDAKLSLDVTGSTDLDKIFSSRNPSYTNNATGLYGTGVSDLNTHSIFQLGSFSHTSGGAVMVGTSIDQASGTGLDLAGIIGATALSNTAVLISAGKYSGSTDVLAPIGASEDALKIENISASGINTSGNATLLEVKGNGQVSSTNGFVSGSTQTTGFHSMIGKTSGTLKLTTQDATSTYQLFLPAGYPTVGQVIGDSANSGTNIYTAWQNGGSGSGVTTVGTFSGSSQTNGASISGTTITFGPSDATNPGMVTTGAQTIAGVKTFNSSPVVPTPAAGDNSTNAASTAYVDRAARSMFTQTANGTVLTNTTTQTNIMGTGVGSMTLAANSFYAGETIVLHGFLMFSTGATPGSISFSTPSGGFSETYSIPASATNNIIEFTDYVTILTTGVSGTAMEQMTLITTTTNSPYANATTSTTYTFNTTTSKDFSLNAQWQSALTTNSIKTIPSFTLRIQ